MRISYAMLWRLCYPVISEELLKNCEPGNDMIRSVFSGNLCEMVPTMDKGRGSLELWRPITRLLKYSKREDVHLSQGSGVRMWRKMYIYLGAIRTKPSD